MTSLFIAQKVIVSPDLSVPLEDEYPQSKKVYVLSGLLGLFNLKYKQVRPAVPLLPD